MVFRSLKYVINGAKLTSLNSRLMVAQFYSPDLQIPKMYHSWCLTHILKIRWLKWKLYGGLRGQEGDNRVQGGSYSAVVLFWLKCFQKMYHLWHQTDIFKFTGFKGPSKVVTLDVISIPFSQGPDKAALFCIVQKSPFHTVPELNFICIS